MLKQHQQNNVAQPFLTTRKHARWFGCPRCHVAQFDPCVDAHGAQMANHIERVNAAVFNVFNTPQANKGISPAALAFVEGYLMSWQLGPTLARLTPREQEVGARALNALPSGRALLEGRHRYDHSLEEIAARQEERPLHFIAKIYDLAIQNLAGHAMPLLETCCPSCRQHMPDVIFDVSLRCPECLASLPHASVPFPGADDIRELKRSCAVLETSWTASMLEIETAYEKRRRLWADLRRPGTPPRRSFADMQSRPGWDADAWAFIQSYHAKYGHQNDR